MNLTHPHRQQAPLAVDLPELWSRLRTLPAAARLSALADAVARLAHGGTPMNARRNSAAEAVRAVMVARNLRRVAPTVDTVRTVPVFTDAGPRGARIAVRVNLADVLRLPLAADAETHRAAYDVLRRAFPRAQWQAEEYRYDVRTGRLLLTTPGAAE
ncbi:hypothetical protein GCM10018980_25740 [Streptomyces capoamus]|uniref:Uncharacterized protein n=1 Tax=Streptomyces capoamus TaxID=68183 RepID=A0A919C3I5_9ACTN|nr:hypothetical protein [Streptomyces capoamus]GGW19895.1 hypothetical protein GCM10010501_60510 [Streptomyces libani subsp. rufus]GHG46636.1 hypothetical protein GCM10018980_25740 [Streptomyces capoamus]